MKVLIPQVIPETPAWACTFGVDTRGVFAGINVAGVIQMLRWIKPGKFVMGSPEGEVGRFEDEGPQHEVTIPNGFWLGQTPVTQAFYEAVAGTNPSEFKGESLRPVEQVSWEDAGAFCTKLNEVLSEFGPTEVRLPTEAEWEYACRAGEAAALYSGKELTGESGACPNLEELAWYDQNSGGTTRPVGQKRPNKWGLHDMLGNVDEWCEDTWHDDYEGAPTDGSAWVEGGEGRVSRGGVWLSSAWYCRCAYRGYWLPDRRNRYLGFRLVLAPRSREASQSR